MDPEDEGDPIRTALRETAEEVGIETRFIQPLGLFHDVTSLNGLIVTPVVAFIPNWSVVSRQHVIVSEDEVEEIFEVPLTTLTDPGIYSLDLLKRGVLPRYAVDPERREKDIWGMTAYISDWLLRSTFYNL
jgi:8-oxo-dGTP pyrophosphatase MutT (NUDIX family)